MPVALGAGVLEVRVADVGADELVGGRRIFLAHHARVVRVPEQRDVRHRGASRILRREAPSVKSPCDSMMTRDAAALGVLAERAQPVDHPGDHGLARLARRNLVAKDADVGDLQTTGEIDEAAALVELRRADLGVGFVHARGRAEIRDLEVERGQVLHGLIDAAADELGPLRQIHLAFDAAQLDRGIAQAPTPARGCAASSISGSRASRS